MGKDRLAKGLGSDRRARSTVAAGDERPMNARENGPKYVASVALCGARVAERTRRVAVTHSHRPTIAGRVFLHLLHPGPRIRLQAREDGF